MFRTTLLLALAGIAILPAAASAQVAREYVTGLRAPMKTLALPDGTLLVTEAGAAPNTGRVSLVDRDGRRFTVIDALPSGLHGPATPEPAGPTSSLLFGRRLYILIGNGDVSIAAPNSVERVNPAPSSPLFSSLLLLELPEDGPDLAVGFALPRAAQDRIAGGDAAYLTNADGQVARLSRVADFVDYVALPRPDVPENIQISNTFAMTGNGTRFDVVDAARNLLWTVSLQDRAPWVLTTFPPVANTTPMLGPPVVDAVPTSLHA